LFFAAIHRKLMNDDADQPRDDSGAPTPQFRGDGADLVGAALDYLRGGVSADRGPSGAPTLARQKADLCEWAERFGRLLTIASLPTATVRGGQEHNLFHDEIRDRYVKVTRHGVFGLRPGIELALVSSSQDARRFHLWEASPLEYLERLLLQNQLVPGLNALEGVIVDAGAPGDLAIVTSQPRFDLVRVTTAGIDAWFASLGFVKITDAAYYRAADNLGIFDAHDKNLVRAGEVLVPFDVIPCRPGGGFLKFIEDALAAGHHLRAVRTVTTKGAEA